MGSVRTIWHVMFGDLLDEEKPPLFELKREAPLAGEPQRADYLLLRRLGHGADDQAGVLRRLWSNIRTDALVELKSPARLVERGDLMRLVGYGCQYAVKERTHIVKGEQVGRFSELDDLLLVLATPRMTPNLMAEINFLPGVSLSSSVNGYARLHGLYFPALVILLEEVSKAEQDEVLALFGDNEPWSLEAGQWLDAHLWGAKSERKDINMENLEGYKDMIQRMLKKSPTSYRLLGLEPEEIPKLLAELPPEQRLAEIPPEQLPKLLAGLSSEQILKMLEQLPAELLERARKQRDQ